MGRASQSCGLACANPAILPRAAQQPTMRRVAVVSVLALSSSQATAGAASSGRDSRCSLAIATRWTGASSTRSPRRWRRQNLVRSDFLKHGEGNAALPLALLIGEALGLVYDFVDTIKNRITLAAVSQGSGQRLAEHRVGDVDLHDRIVRPCVKELSAEA